MGYAGTLMEVSLPSMERIYRMREGRGQAATASASLSVSGVERGA